MIADFYVVFQLPTKSKEIALVSGSLESLLFERDLENAAIAMMNNIASSNKCEIVSALPYVVIKCPIGCSQAIMNMQDSLSSHYGENIPFGIGNDQKTAVYGMVLAKQKNTKIEIFVPSKQEKIQKSEDFVDNLVKTEVEEFDQNPHPEIDEEQKEMIYNTNPVAFQEHMVEFQKVLSNFRDNLSAFDLIATLNPAAYSSILAVVQSTVAFADLLIESGLVPHENVASNMAQADLTQGMAQPEAGAPPKMQEQEENKTKRGVPIGTIRRVNINGKPVMRVKMQDGKWHYVNRGQVAGKTGVSGVKIGATVGQD